MSPGKHGIGTLTATTGGAGGLVKLAFVQGVSIDSAAGGTSKQVSTRTKADGASETTES